LFEFVKECNAFGICDSEANKPVFREGYGEVTKISPACILHGNLIKSEISERFL